MVVIPGALLVGLLGLDLYTWRRPLLATLIGFVVYFGFDAVLDPVIKMHWAQQLTLWAQHHP
jgi:hypothetical protein